MQTLWARIGQSRTCYKRFSTAALVQPSATTPLRRHVGLDDVLAAGFSTVAFASAVVDGNRKDARTNKWARAIREEKRKLHALQEDQERRIANLEQGKNIDPPSTRQEIAPRPPQSWQDVFIWADAEIRERKQLGFETWQGIPLSVLRNASPDQIQDALNNHSNYFPKVRGVVGPQVWNSVTWPFDIKKIRTLEWSIARLALELMRNGTEDQVIFISDRDGTAQKVLTQLSIGSPQEVIPGLDNATDQLNELSRGERKNDEYYHAFPSPKFPRYDADRAEDPDSADELNARLYSLLQSTNRPSTFTPQLIPKICSHLLSSTSPPNIHTFNLLLSEFGSKRQDHLIVPLLASLYRSHVRPNEITLAETLKHYIRKDDSQRFRQYVNRMEGFCHGLQRAHPDMYIPDLFKFHYRVRRIPLVSVEGEVQDEYYDLSDVSSSELIAMKENATVKVYEKPRCNLEVHRALIKGSLFFNGLFAGLYHYRKMVSEGWESDQDILFSILHHCIVHAEWDAGVATWSHIQRRGDLVDENGYLLMLQLCQRCDRQDAIQEVLRDGVVQDVLPSTVLEMDWDIVGPLTQQTQDNSKALAAARKALMWVQDLEQLMYQPLGEGSKDQDVRHRISVLLRQIKNVILRPSLETTSLVSEAKTLAAIEFKRTNFDAALHSSSELLLNLIHSFKDIQSSMKARGYMAQLAVATPTIAQCVEQVQGILPRIPLATLQSSSTQIFQETQRFLRAATVQWGALQCGIYLARFNAICYRTFSLRYELSPHVPKFRTSHIEHIEKRIIETGARINRIAAQVRLSSRAVDSWQVIGKKKRAVALPRPSDKRRLVVEVDPQPSIVNPLQSNPWTSYLKSENELISSMNDFYNSTTNLLRPTAEPRQAIQTEGQADPNHRAPVRDFVKKRSRFRIMSVKIDAFRRKLKHLEFNIRTISRQLQPIASSITLRTLNKGITDLAVGTRAIAKELSNVCFVSQDGSVTLEMRDAGVQMQQGYLSVTPETQNTKIQHGVLHRVKSQTSSKSATTSKSRLGAATSGPQTLVRAVFPKSTASASSSIPASVADSELQHALSLGPERRQSSQRIDASQWAESKGSMSALEHG
ncbi:MAG: hypothetical protein Q9174_004787 [Haloplaca sp. 1 TL-2023]